MKTKTKILVGSLLFITLYMGALSVYSFTFIAPGSTIDPACPPTGLTACTVHVLGFDANGFLDTGSINLVNSASSQLYVGDDLLGEGSSGTALIYTRNSQSNGIAFGDLTNSGMGDQTTWVGYIDPTMLGIENSLRVTPSYSSLYSINSVNSSSVITDSNTVSITASDGVQNNFARLNLSSGFVIKGKDDLSTSQNFKLKSNTDVELFKMMNDGTLTATRTVPNGTFVSGNFETTHPLLGVPLNYSGSWFTLPSGATMDIGVYDIPSLPAQGAGQHYLDLANNIYLGSDLTSTDSSVFNSNTLTGATTALIANFTDVLIVASPDGINANRLVINNDTDGIVFTGLDDLTSSVLVNFENDSGTELMQLKNDGTFTNTRGNFSLVNNANFGSPASGAMIIDGVDMFTSGVVDLSGLGGGNTSGNFYFNTGLLRNFSVVTSDGVHLAVNSGLSQNTSFSINATGGDAGISGDIAGALFSVFNVGSNSVNNVGMIIGAGLDDSSVAGPSTLISFEDGTGDVVGSITFGSSVTAYNTTSDERLKENITDTALSLDDLMRIQIRDYTWRADNGHKLSHGVIAQELAVVYPGAVTIPTDPSKYWMVDYSKLTPLTIKAIQDLNFKISSIETITQDGVFVNNLKEFFADTGNSINEFIAGTIRARSQLCIDDLCVNKDQLQQLLNNNFSSSFSGSSSTTGGTSGIDSAGTTDTGTTGSSDSSSTTGEQATGTTDGGTGSVDGVTTTTGDTPSDTGTDSTASTGSGQASSSQTPPEGEEGSGGEVVE